MQTMEERESIVLHNKGQKIFGVLHKPLKKSKHPVVLICHGLAGHKTGKYRLYVSLAKKLALEGIATLRIDYRGSGDSEGEFYETTIDGVVSDILVALKFLKDHSDVDSSRLGLFGRSFGGAMALMAAKEFQNIRSLALWAPIFSGEPWLDKWKLVESNAVTESQKRELMSVNGQEASLAFFEQFFKMKLDHVLSELNTIPLLHIHGDKDSVVTTVHAEKYIKYREHALGETKFIRLPDADHDFSKPHEQEKAIKTTVEWFKETLKT